MAEPTRSQIEKFVKVRARSELPSNLQFMIDCKEAGFKVGDLPKAEKCDDGSYQWTLSHGTMDEVRGVLSYYPGL